MCFISVCVPVSFFVCVAWETGVVAESTGVVKVAVLLLGRHDEC